MEKMRRSRKYKGHGLQPEEMVEGILDLLVLLCEAHQIPIPTWLMEKESPEWTKEDKEEEPEPE